MTEAKPLQQVDRTWVRCGRRRLSYFSGCDYFRLASDPRVLEAVQEGLKRFGLNVAASRVTTGNHKLYRKLEHRLAEFFLAEGAVLLPTGFAASLAAAQGLAGSFTHALVDERAHVCLQDAARLLGCPMLRFRHRDAADLARVVGTCGRRAKPILVTDGLFARDGSVAPLKEYLAALPPGGMLLVDDAHAAGVIGAHGRGSLEHCGVPRDRIIQTITLSKAFGVYGGAVLCARSVRAKLISTASLFAGATPLPLPLVNAALTSVRILATDSSFRWRLQHNTQTVRTGLRAAGMSTPDTPGPIVTLPPKAVRRPTTLSQRLLAGGIYPPFIRYPGGESKGCFRFVISSEHTPAQLANLVEALTRDSTR